MNEFTRQTLICVNRVNPTISAILFFPLLTVDHAISLVLISRPSPLRTTAATALYMYVNVENATQRTVLSMCPFDSLKQFRQKQKPMNNQLHTLSLAFLCNLLAGKAFTTFLKERRYYLILFEGRFEFEQSTFFACETSLWQEYVHNLRYTSNILYFSRSTISCVLLPLLLLLSLFCCTC